MCFLQTECVFCKWNVSCKNQHQEFCDVGSGRKPPGGWCWGGGGFSKAGGFLRSVSEFIEAAFIEELGVEAGLRPHDAG